MPWDFLIQTPPTHENWPVPRCCWVLLSSGILQRHLHCYLFHEDLTVKPSSSLHCVQHISHVQPSRAPFPCSCVLGFDALVGWALVMNASAPSSVPCLPNALQLPHLKRQGSRGCYIFLFSSRYQQLQELWPSTSCQEGLQPAPITQPTVGLGWESPDLGVTWQGQGPVDFSM